ncbi:hypothetical protein [Pseudofrankia inefficax]|uniref:Uncharacterized protein n=1 Tax=Pseudofrankia inefficax (strain DSM 45817 / CECT 9037 / DDB 130130 / EuI1c) TaxID=298654 RepID=E3IWG4_PSEI1|nr:hypothetical protein [Pseudofrankia inefficax]ADP80147.1 hypothetical protein FraEuI1c_2098 [Pseudofrankia inefficax]
MSPTAAGSPAPQPPAESTTLLWLGLAGAISVIAALLTGMLAHPDGFSLAGAVLAGGGAFATSLGLAIAVLQAARKL